MCLQDFPDGVWQEAQERALSVLDVSGSNRDIDTVLELTLGEGQFGPDHWSLSRIKRLYYFLKPLLPRSLTRALRKILRKRYTQNHQLSWPIEPRYAQFQFNVLKNLLELTGKSNIEFSPLWPDGKRFALALTHDIETNKGQRFVSRVADLEESLGFRSSFNFVPEGYRVDMNLIKELRQRGFEVGVHGLKHDGKLFNCKKEFLRSAEKINRYLNKFEAVGFRAPLTIRNPEWMQALNIEYDLSFFDTDPFEPIYGGSMSIWPFFIGRFVELPYTLVQDYTLTSVLGETTPKIWLEKIEFIEKYHGMALLNSHPDYLSQKTNWDVYYKFLLAMKNREGFWNALPREIARWWQSRAANESNPCASVASLKNGDLILGVGFQGDRNSYAPISKPAP